MRIRIPNTGFRKTPPVLWDEVHPAGLGRLLQIDLDELEVLGVTVGPEHGLASQVRHVVIVGLQTQGWNQGCGSGYGSTLNLVAGSGSRREKMTHKI
jgi:hypothetical protein